jgi:hypothetical protein
MCAKPTGRVPTEASGNVTEQTMAAIAATNVDFVSVGAITYGAASLPSFSSFDEISCILLFLNYAYTFRVEFAGTRSLHSIFPSKSSK